MAKRLSALGSLFLAAVMSTQCSGIGDVLQVSRNNLHFPVNGVGRSAMVFLGQNSATTAAPLLLFFHGHTGTASTSSALNFHGIWPEATVVYAQGLKDIQGSGGVDFGWQDRPGVLSDRDLAYVDELIVQIKLISLVDDTKVFAAGHSNGCMLTFTLMESRNSVFAGYGPTSCYAKSSTLSSSGVSDPLIYAFGTGDTVFDQDSLCPSGGAACAAQTHSTLQTLNGCSEPTTEWNSGYSQYTCTNANYIYYNYSGDHSWPTGHEERLVEFFKTL